MKPKRTAFLILALAISGASCLDPSPRFDGLRRGQHQLVAADTSSFTDATEAWVDSVKRYYRFAPDCIANDPRSVEVVEARGGGCWVAESGAGEPAWLARALSFDLGTKTGGVYVDAAAGDDAGAGSAADPIRTFAELVRRLGGQEALSDYDFAGRTGAGVFTAQVVSDTAEDLVVDGVSGRVMLVLGVPRVLSNNVVTAVGAGIWDGGTAAGWIDVAGVPAPALDAPSVWLHRHNAADASDTYAPVVASDGARVTVGQQVWEDAAPNLGVHYAGGAYLIAAGDSVDVVRFPRVASVVDASLTDALVVHRLDLGTYGAVWRGALAAGIVGVLEGQNVLTSVEIRGGVILGNSNFGSMGSAIFFRGVSAGAAGVPTQVSVSGADGYFQRMIAYGATVWTGDAEVKLDTCDWTNSPQAVIAQRGSVIAQSPLTGRGNVNGVRVEQGGTVSGFGGFAGLFAGCSGAALLVDGGAVVPPAPVSRPDGTEVRP